MNDDHELQDGSDVVQCTNHQTHHTNIHIRASHSINDKKISIFGNYLGKKHSDHHIYVLYIQMSFVLCTALYSVVCRLCECLCCMCVSVYVVVCLCMM